LSGHPHASQRHTRVLVGTKRPTNMSSVPSGFFVAPQKSLPVVPRPGAAAIASTPAYSYNGTNHQSIPPSRQQPITSFRCEACNIYLNSQSSLESHISSHETCSECSFSASPTVLKGHYDRAHGKFSKNGFKSVTIAVPGCPIQRFRICVGNHPEDIRAWIVERKKRFPRSSPPAKQTKQAPAGISSLLSGYGSSSSSDDESGETKAAATPTPSPTETSPLQSASPVKTKPCRFFARLGTCKNGDSCRFLHEKMEPAAKRHRVERPKDTTLLQKLLRNDQRRETALTLQLLEFIVETDFLTKEPSENE